MNRAAVLGSMVGIFAMGLTVASGQRSGPVQHVMHMRRTAELPDVSATQDARELVRLPEPMQEHMLGNMRDHLATLNDIIGDVADNKFDEAANLAEQRLGMSSLALHDAAHMAPFMPKEMQDLGTTMHRAASRLAIVLQDAAVAQTIEARRKVDGALHEVTSACAGCHASYRIR